MTFRRLGRLFAAMLLLSLVSLWLLFAGVTYESYSNEWKAAGAFVSNINSLLSLDIARNIELYDLSLRAAGDRYVDPAIRSLPPDVRRKVLFDRSASASGLGSLIIVDRTGTIVATSREGRLDGSNVTAWESFRVHAGTNVSGELYVSHPFKSHGADESWTIALSRRLQNADGSFAGVAIGTLKISYFLRLFGAVHLPEMGAITLVHDDGTVLIRSRLVDIGRDLSGSEVYRRMVQMRAGQLTRASSIDHVKRLFSFAPIDHLPIMLMVGIPTDDFLQRWRWRMALVAFGFAILSGFIVVLAVTLGNEFHRRTLAEEALLELAVTDGLTALANRRQFDETLNHEWSRALRHGSSLALLMVDSDCFKAYNDTYGHLQGDEALRVIAGALRDVVQRPADLIARFGGEEFAVLLPGTDLDGALRVGETIREAVERLAWPHARGPFGVLTVSIGVAACLPSPSIDALALVQAADFALYEAKESGRNRTATGERLDLTSFGWRAAS